ncbi:MAG TPA: hypothetical protein VHH53_06410 [Pseudonocardiaceae bacterium]|nr:hypothetical protein [Pseudonocardiaceae bacterium]
MWIAALLLLGCGVGLVAVGWYSLTSYGLDPFEGGVLAPLSQRLLMGAMFILPGLGVCALVIGYPLCYVTRIESNQARDEFRVRLLTGQELAVRLEDVVTAEFKHGRFQNVNAPWYSVRLRGRRLPLMVDIQGELLDQEAADRLLADA